jgi:hypothetical protein
MGMWLCQFAFALGMMGVHECGQAMALISGIRFIGEPCCALAWARKGPPCPTNVPPPPPF